MSADDGGSLTEAAAVGVFGGVLGAAVGWPLGLSVPFGLVAAANGAVSGWRRVYDWRTSKGVTAAVLDSTWALPMTAAALFANAVGAVTEGGYVDDLSRRSNRHVYERGFMPRKGFAITLGNVISGAGDCSKPRRRRLITDHEDVHVWQARWLGPLYPGRVRRLDGHRRSGRIGRMGDPAPRPADRQGRGDVRLLPQPARVVGVQP